MSATAFAPSPSGGAGARVHAALADLDRVLDVLGEVSPADIPGPALGEIAERLLASRRRLDAATASVASPRFQNGRAMV